MLSQSEGQMLLDIMDYHGLEQMVPFPACDYKNTLDLIPTSIPGQFQVIHSPDKLSDHDIVSAFLRIFIPHTKKLLRKVYSYQKGDFEIMRKDALRFANEKYFSCHSDARSVQENFNLITSLCPNFEKSCRAYCFWLVCSFVHSSRFLVHSITRTM